MYVCLCVLCPFVSISVNMDTFTTASNASKKKKTFYSPQGVHTAINHSIMLLEVFDAGGIKIIIPER